MRMVPALLDGGPGDGQTVQVAQYPDGVTRARVWVTVLDGKAHVLEDDATVLDRAARAGAEWFIYALRSTAHDAAAGLPVVYVPAGGEQE